MITMTIIDWINELCVKNILTTDTFNGQQILRLHTPCDILITEYVSKVLFDNYDPIFEKGGILAAFPENREGKILLIVKEVVFIKNVSVNPEHSYLPAKQELNNTLKRALNDQFLPIRFHTHPTAHENPIMEIISYVNQSDTSKQDQLVSYNMIKICNQLILLPRSLILALGKSMNRMFIGFYSGLIAPVEFETHKKEQMQKAMNTIIDSISQWASKGNNKWWLVGGGFVFIYFIIRYYKTALPLVFLLLTMTPMFINNPNEKPKYFVQLTKEQVTIEIP